MRELQARTEEPLDTLLRMIQASRSELRRSETWKLRITHCRSKKDIFVTGELSPLVPVEKRALVQRMLVESYQLALYFSS